MSVHPSAGIVASNADSVPVVLVVDDERNVADTYALQLQDCDTRVAYGGEEALAKMDEDVDAVLLDRRMPDISGDDVLATVRDRGYDTVVVMATAVDPDLNILEMEFDDYLCKPIDRETLVGTLANHLDPVARRTDDVATFLSLLSKIDVLKAERSPAELADSDEYQRLEARAAELETRLRESVDEFEEMVATYRDIDRGG